MRQTHTSTTQRAKINIRLHTPKIEGVTAAAVLPYLLCKKSIFTQFAKFPVNIGTQK